MKHIQREQFSFTKTSIFRDTLKSVSENRCLCFKPASRCLRFSKMNSRQENRSKLSFTAKIITKYSLERSLSICGEKMSEDLLTHGAPQARFLAPELRYKWRTIQGYFQAKISRKIRIFSLGGKTIFLYKKESVSGTCILPSIKEEMTATSCKNKIKQHSFSG